MTKLSEAEARALGEALDDEYRAWAIYDQVIRDFGSVRPFSNIRDSEARHIDALVRLFQHYGLTVPENRWPASVPRYATLGDACAAAVAGEVENDKLYEQLLSSASRPDILNVFQCLKEASQQRHLPAFRRCAERHGIR